MYNETHNFRLEEQGTPTPDPVHDDPPPIEHKLSKLTIAILGGVALILALIGIDVALISGAQSSPPRPVIQHVTLSGGALMPSTMYMTVSPDIKPGPDGKLHDAFSVTNFDVRVGHPVKLVINNTDGAPHSITAPDAGVDIVIKPGIHTYTLLVHRTGKFAWFCKYPCDPYAMSHVGYMRGYITAV